MEERILVKGKREPKSLFLKLGFALALSIAGYFSSQSLFRPRLPLPPPNSTPVPKKSDSKSTGTGRLKDELRILTREEELAKVLNGTHNSSSTAVVPGFDQSVMMEEFETYPESKTPLEAKNNEMGRLKLEMKVHPESKTHMEAKNYEMESEKLEVEAYPERNNEMEKEKLEMEAYPESKTFLESKNKELEWEKEKEKLEMEEYPESKTFLESKNKEMEWEKEKLEMEEEIGYLRNIVEALKERERTLEVQLIEFYGMEEQEATLRELENRVKVNAMESKMLHLKIDSLQANNQKLRSQVSDYPRAVAELEDAREEIKVLKEKLKFEGKDTKQKLASLHGRVTKLQDRILEDRGIDTEVEEKLRRVEELENEVTDLHKEKSRLVEVNLELVQQLESTKVAASSHLKDREVEASCLREENEKLKKEIEQLQTDRCMDVEELVYLRWVNACLRYELRNYQPALGKTVARDLGKSLSPKSEEKAKQLILQYAHSGIDGKSMVHFDFDTESWSSRASSDECTDTSIDISSSSKNSSSSKSKFLGKLRKLVLGKDRQKSKDKSHGMPTSCGSFSRRTSISPCSLDESNERRSFDSISSRVSVENDTGVDSHATDQWLSNTTQSQKASRLSLNVERIRKIDVVGKDNIGDRCKSDIGRSHGHMRIISEGESFNGLFDNKDLEDSDVPEKVKLKKFADVLKGSHGSQKLKSKRRSTSFSSN